MILVFSHRGFYKPVRASYVPGCAGCGACCNGVFSVPVKAEESASLEPWTLEQWNRNGAIVDEMHAPGLAVIKKWRNFVIGANEDFGRRCRKLTGHVGENAQCSIYNARPTDCRTFIPGSWNCLACRHVFGVDVPAWFRKAHRRLDRQVFNRKRSAEED